MGRLEFDPSAPPPDPGNDVEYVACFRFPVTWDYLSGAPPEAEPGPRVRTVAKPSPPAAMALVSPVASPSFPQSSAICTITSGGGSSLADAHAQWEMVI